MSNFWDDIVRKYGAREDVVGIPGAPSITNKYIEYLEYRVLAPYLSLCKGLRVLDVGTGIGRWASFLAEKASFVVGIDISREMIKMAKKRLKKSNVDFVVATAYAIPLCSNSIDISLSCTCIQHVADRRKQQECLHEIARVTESRILLLELMSRASQIKLTHYPTLVIPKNQYVSAFQTSDFESICDIGVDFLPILKIVEDLRNSLFKKFEVKVPSYGGAARQRVLRNSYQILSALALLCSLPFNKMVPVPSSDLTRHVLLVLRKNK